MYLEGQGPLQSSATKTVVVSELLEIFRIEIKLIMSDIGHCCAGIFCSSLTSITFSPLV